MSPVRDLVLEVLDPDASVPLFPDVELVGTFRIPVPRLPVSPVPDLGPVIQLGVLFVDSVLGFAVAAFPDQDLVRVALLVLLHDDPLLPRLPDVI